MDTARQQSFWHSTLAGTLYTVGAVAILAGTAMVFGLDYRIGLPLIATGTALLLLARKNPLPATQETYEIVLPSCADTPLTKMTQIPESWPGSDSRLLTFAIVAASQRPILSRFESETGLKLTDLYGDKEEYSEIISIWLDWIAVNFFKIPQGWPGSASRFLAFAIVAASQRPILSRFEADTGLILTDLYGDKEEDSKIISTWLDWIAVNFFNANSCIYTER